MVELHGIDWLFQSAAERREGCIEIPDGTVSVCIRHHMGFRRCRYRRLLVERKQILQLIGPKYHVMVYNDNLPF